MPAPQKLAMPSGRTEQVVTELTTVLDVAESPAVEGGLRLGDSYTSCGDTTHMCHAHDEYPVRKFRIHQIMNMDGAVGCWGRTVPEPEPNIKRGPRQDPIRLFDLDEDVNQLDMSSALASSCP